jgi:hypothetical protein
MECKVIEVKELGDKGGAGNLIICEIVRIHIQEDVLNAQGQIDQEKIDLVARMGGNWYCRAHGEALFEVDKPLTTRGIGFDNLPATILNSTWLTGNDLGMLANVEALPIVSEAALALYSTKTEEEKHQIAAQILRQGDVLQAWQVLLS